MDNIIFGILAGVVFGLVSVLIMMPIKFKSNRERWDAMAGAFIDRFMIGLIIPNITLGVNPIITGALLGLGLSLPSAIISRAYAPILTIGVLGGLIIGYYNRISFMNSNNSDHLLNLHEIK